MKNNSFCFALALFTLLFGFHFSALAQKRKKKSDFEQEQIDDRISTRMGYEIEPEKRKSKLSKAESEAKGKKPNKIKTKVKPIIPTNEFVEKVTWKRQIAYEEAREDPTYGDPMYFGHKRKPKKRPPGKRKFCKECGMVH